jgi:putative ABC transport system permease protein
MQSGWPTPIADIQYGTQTLGDVAIFGVTAPYQVVQDYTFASGRPLSDIDVLQRRNVAVIGADVADKLFEHLDPVGKDIRVLGNHFTIVGVIAKKGRVLGQSFDGFVLLPLTTFESIYGRRKTTTVSVKMAKAEDVAEGMALADGAMRTAHKLRPGQESDYSIETADALVAFWKSLTKVLFSVIPAIVGIGIVFGGIVIMNIMLMSVSERTREIGVRKALGARSRDIRRQFLAEAIVLASTGGLMGVATGWGLAFLVAYVSPLPAKVTAWSVMLALALGAGVGVLFGVYPAARAAELDPIAALRQE